MPVTLAIPPAAVLEELARTLPRVAASTAIGQRSPAITRAAGRFNLAQQLRLARTPVEVADADAIAMPVYTVGLDDLAAGRLQDGAKQVLWSQIVTTEAGPVSAEVDSRKNSFAQITNAAAGGRARASLIRLSQGAGMRRGAADDDADEPDGEAAELRIPALHFSFLWFRGGRGSFEVLDSTDPQLPVGRRIGAAALQTLLQARAAERLAAEDADG